MAFRSLKKCALGAVILTAAMGLALPASATLIGDTVTISSQANAPLDTWTDNVLVGGGIELTAGDGSNHSLAGPFFAHLFSPGDSIDIGANSITMNFTDLGAAGFPYAFQTIFSGFDWTDTPGSLQGVVLAAGATGLTAFNISAINASGFTFQGTVDLVNGANFTLDLLTVHDDPLPVPEPGTLALLGAGLLGLFMRRKRVA